jgi:branched-chain amino acid transport system substrate-binding protein
VAGAPQRHLVAAEPPDGRLCGEGAEAQARRLPRDDFAFGHENVAGFQRAFEDAGGKVVQKIFTPLNAPDYAPTSPNS